MMKKRKNVQFIAAAALTAALVTSQFSFATVMGDDTSTVQVSGLIPNNVTIDQPVPLSDICISGKGSHTIRHSPFRLLTSD